MIFSGPFSPSAVIIREDVSFTGRPPAGSREVSSEQNVFALASRPFGFWGDRSEFLVRAFRIYAILPQWGARKFYEP